MGKHSVTQRARLLGAAALFGFGLSGAGAQQAGIPAVTPPDYSSMAPPAVGGSYVDPVFGTKITRLTDATVLAEPEQGIVPEYSQTSAFNLDDTYIVLYWVVSGSFHLYDAAGNYIRVLSGVGSLSEPRWSRTNPHHLYYHRGKTIFQHDVATNQTSTIETFSQYGSLNFGTGQGDLSDNERLVVVGDDRYIFVYDVATQTQFGVLDNNQAPVGGKSFDAVTISKDGESFVVSYNTQGGNRGDGMEQYDLSGIFMVQLQNAIAHFAMGRDVDGAPVMYVANSATNPQQPAGCHNGVVKISLDGAATRACLLILDWTADQHLSAHGNDGWVYISTYQAAAEPVAAGPGDANDVTKWHAYTNEIFRVRGDGSVVERLVHHRSRLDTYFRQPHASISMSGNMLVYGSDFRQTDYGAEYVDTYLIDLSGRPATIGAR